MQYETKYRPDMPKKEITNVLYDVLTVYINIDRFYGNVWQQIAKMNNLPGTLPAGKGYHAKEETFGAWIRRLIKSPINYDKYDCHYVTFPRKEEDLKLVQTGTYEKIKDPSLGAKLHSRMDTLQTESIWEIMDIYIPSEDGKTEHAFTTSDMVELLAEYCFTHPKAMEALIPKMIEISNRKYRNLHAAQDFQKTKENRNPQNLEEINELLAKEDYEQFWFFLKEAVPSEGHDISLLAFPNRVNIDSRRHILCITTECSRYMHSLIFGGNDDAPFRTQISPRQEAYVPLLISSYMPYRWMLTAMHADDSQLRDLRRIAAHKPMLTTRDMSGKIGLQPVFPVQLSIAYNYLALNYEDKEARKSRRTSITQKIDCWLYAGEEVPADEELENDGFPSPVWETVNRGRNEIQREKPYYYVCKYEDLKLSLDQHSENSYGVCLTKGSETIRNDIINVCDARALLCLPQHAELR